MTEAGQTPPPPAPVCLTRRVWTITNRVGNSLHPYRWFWRAGIILIVFLWIWWVTNPWVGTGALAAMVLFAIGAEFGPVLIDLPVLLLIVLAWLVMSITSILDLALFLPHLFRKGNRLTLAVLATNSSLLVVVWVLFIL